MTTSPLRRLDAVLAALLLAAVWLVFASVRGHGFVSIDDPDYLLLNPVVKGGLTGDGVAWAFGALQGGNWHPLTWISHMAVVSLFGLDPGPHHVVNVLLHGAATVALYLALVRLCGARWPSAAAAALFAVHPLHVESVAWVSERKDVLSGLFWMLALLAYERHARRPSAARLLLVFSLLALGLMAKPMLVTLPVVLLLLDYWPLGRLGAAGGPPGSHPAARLLLEKAPLFALAAGASALAFVAQRQSHAMSTLESIGLAVRLGNALLSTVLYLRSMLWPTDLAMLYPYSRELIRPLTVAGSALVLAALSAAAWRSRRRHPFLLTGWLWYGVTLLPVIGIVQVGQQMRADRYTYLPLVGLFVATAWAVAAAVGRRPAWRVAMAAATIAALVSLGAAARVQVGYWRTSLALFQRSLEVSPDNPTALKGVGVLLTQQGKAAEGQRLVARAHQLDPHLRAESHYRSGIAMKSRGQWTEAARFFREALALEPGYVDASEALEALLREHPEAGGPASAPRAARWGAPPHGSAADLAAAVPGGALARGNALSAAHRYEEAAAAYREATRQLPGSAPAFNNLGCALMMLERWSEAEAAFREALRLRPGYEQARQNLRAVEARRR